MMTISESCVVTSVKKRLAKNHATREEIERVRAILAGDERALERFNALVAEKSLAKKSGDRTAAERKARQRERENAFTVLEPGDMATRESCRLDLAKFGWTYCRNLLNHQPSEAMVRGFILPLQNVILYGGMNIVQQPRGIGKTTWMKIAMIWAVVYGHKRFVMTVAATRDHAKSINEQILRTFESSDALSRDFPALVAPIRALAGNWRKASTQKFEGRPTRMVNSDGYIVLPTIYRTGTDLPVEVGAGAVFYTAGIHGAVRGIGVENQRPDIVLLDDPQTREEAESAAGSDKLERLIEGDIQGNFGQTDVRSMVMAITPIRPGDIASRFSDRRLHPTWGSSKQPYITERSDGFDALFQGYRQAYADDVAAQRALAARGEAPTPDVAWAASTRFYVENREAFAGTVVVDPLNFNRFELDAVHHILNVRASYRDQSLFEAELQMDVAGESGGDALDPDEVAARVNGYRRGILPPGTFDCTAFIDVNTAAKAGLRWQVQAFGPDGRTALVERGMFPEDGSALVPPHADPATKHDLIKRGIWTVVRKIVQLQLRHPNGTRVFPVALGVDAGYAPDAVHEAVAEIANNVVLHGMDLFCTLGRSWSQYMNFRKADEREVVSKDHVYAGVSLKRVNGKVYARKYLGVHADFWREVAQKALRGDVGSAGTMSLFGTSSSMHRDWANEVCYEVLMRTYREERKPFRMAWEWSNTNPGHNHAMDCTYNCFAIAAWKGVFQARRGRPSEFAPRVQGQKADWLADAEAREVEQAKTAKPAAPVVKKARPRFRQRFVKR